VICACHQKIVNAKYVKEKIYQKDLKECDNTYRGISYV
jgi:hypothetical protein